VRRAVFAAYGGDPPDARERQRMRQSHPVLVEILASTGFLGTVKVNSYLVTHLGWPGFLLVLGAGLAGVLMFTYGVPNWLHTNLQVLNGDHRERLFPPSAHPTAAWPRSTVPTRR
jgi:hypothetical protein